MAFVNLEVLYLFPIPDLKEKRSILTIAYSTGRPGIMSEATKN